MCDISALHNPMQCIGFNEKTNLQDENVLFSLHINDTALSHNA